MNNEEDKNKIDPELEYKINPYVFENALNIKTKKKKLTVSKGTELVEKKDGAETVFTSTISQIQEVDKEQFIKIFTGQIKLYFDLSQAGFKLYFVLLGIYQKKIGSDEIYFNLETAQEEAVKYDYKISKTVYYRALKELLDKNIIAKSTRKYIFFINPAIFFSGDRAKFVREIKIKQENQDRERRIEEQKENYKLSENKFLTPQEGANFDFLNEEEKIPF